MCVCVCVCVCVCAVSMKDFPFSSFQNYQTEGFYKSSKPFDIQEPFIKSEGKISS